MQKNIAILAAALALASPWAGAQTVWRCGNSYSQQPCEGGNAVSSIDARTPAQAATATRVANADAKLAAEMEKARLAQERNAPKAIVIGPQTPASAPASHANKDGTKVKPGKLDQFTAVSPRPAGEKKKAKRKKKRS